MQIYLSTWITDRSLGQSMTKKKASRRLLSYYFIIEQKITKELLVEYYQRGRCDSRKKIEK